MTFTKLFSSITDSTIWAEADHVRLTWITMLAMSDRRGRVWASIPGLANRARVTVPQVEEAIVRFLSPDEHSSTKNNEGRRIENIEGGWRLLNYQYYRDLKDDESVLESKRKYIQARRSAEKTAVEAIGKKPEKFSRPTLEQAKLSAAKIGLSDFECEKFFNYYESNGWRVGKNPMKSWPHAMVNWSKNAAAYNGQGTVQPTTQTLSDSELVRQAQG
jgi:hypothetical protein